ncbi:MAG: hypothetical protein IJM77_01130, partial [Spirochaetia bacterium]|nr:hypothetical protein [Spirochaetia bacterium]
FISLKNSLMPKSSFNSFFCGSYFYDLPKSAGRTAPPPHPRGAHPRCYVNKTAEILSAIISPRKQVPKISRAAGISTAI